MKQREQELQEERRELAMANAFEIKLKIEDSYCTGLHMAPGVYDNMETKLH